MLFLVTLIISGLSQGMATRVGHGVGRNNKLGLKLTAYVNIGMGFCIMLIFAVIYWIFPEKIISFDLDTNTPKYQAIIFYTIQFLAITAVLQIVDCFRILCVAALHGLKDTKFPMYVSIIAFWLIAFPSAYLLGFSLQLGGVVVWLGLTIGLAIAALILSFRFVWLVNRVDLTQPVTKAD